MAHARGSVLVVDDEPTIGEVVSAYLRRAGYETRVAADGFAALDAVAERSPDLIVLDLMLPGLDGLEVMRRVRERPDRTSAIILLTAKGEESDRVIGLRLGADDYVVKPFSPAELVARVDAVLRRVDTVRAQAPALVFGNLEIDASARRVHREGAELALTQREFDLLHFLARHPGRAFSREELMNARPGWRARKDRKSTRLNSSHPSISYAVFCLKKKKKTTNQTTKQRERSRT